MPLDDLSQPLAEKAVDTHHHLVTGLDDVADGCLHPRHSSARKGDGQLVFGLKEMA